MVRCGAVLCCRCRYEAIKRQHGLWDLPDLVFHIFKHVQALVRGAEGGMADEAAEPGGAVAAAIPVLGNGGNGSLLPNQLPLIIRRLSVDEVCTR